MADKISQITLPDGNTYDIKAKALDQGALAITTAGSGNAVTDISETNGAITVTKDATYYEKPSTGIPKSDLQSSVQTSLGKADTALQSYTQIYTGTYSKPSGGIPKTDLAPAVQTSLGKADTALQSYTEQYTGTYSKPSSGIPKTDLSSSVQTSLDNADAALQGTIDMTRGQDINSSPEDWKALYNTFYAHVGSTFSRNYKMAYSGCLLEGGKTFEFCIPVPFLNDYIGQITFTTLGGGIIGDNGYISDGTVADNNANWLTATTVDSIEAFINKGMMRLSIKLLNSTSTTNHTPIIGHLAFAFTVTGGIS